MARQNTVYGGPALSLNPRSCAASSMAEGFIPAVLALSESQSAFVRGFIDGTMPAMLAPESRTSQSAFVRGFIDG